MNKSLELEDIWRADIISGLSVISTISGLMTSSRLLIWSGPGWSPMATRQFLKEDRNWKLIQQFYSEVIKGRLSLSDLGLVSGEEFQLGNNWKSKIQDLSSISGDCSGVGYQSQNRKTFKLCLSYNGLDFDGWAYNKELVTVEGTLFQTLKNKLDLQTLVVSSAGRTDKGVSACAQVASFYTWRDLSAKDVMDSVNDQTDSSIRVWFVEQVPRSFHATFSAESRRYVYLFPLREAKEDISQAASTPEPTAERLEMLFQSIVGRSLDFYAFARDTPPGKDCHCTITSCNVAKATLDLDRLCGGSGGRKSDCLCIEVTADRFLRKMVRVLVSTAIRESMDEGSRYGEFRADSLLKLAEERDRVLTAPAAPPDGLCLAGINYPSQP